jgi:hypothetical protein
MQQYRLAAEFIEHTVRRVFNRTPMGIERADQVVFAQRRGAEMIFQRFSGDPALNAFAIDRGRERQNEVAPAIRRALLWKNDMHHVVPSACVQATQQSSGTSYRVDMRQSPSG